jgi:hypothetical protein
MPKLGTSTWDATLARRLYDEGALFKDIGEQVGVAPNLVSQFASRHWPPRDKALDYNPGRLKRETRSRPLSAGRSTLPPLPSLRAE